MALYVVIWLGIGFVMVVMLWFLGGICSTDVLPVVFNYLWLMLYYHR